MNNIISKNYSEDFDTLLSFNNGLIKIDNATECMDVSTTDIKPYILLSDKTEAMRIHKEFDIENFSSCLDNTKAKIPCLSKDKNSPWKISDFHLNKLGNGFNTIKDEFFEDSQLVFEYDNEFYVVNKDCYITMLQRLGISCSYFNDGPTIIRGQMIGFLLFEKPSAVRLIVREENGTKVIVAMNSDNFGYIPQETILEAAIQINQLMKKAEFLKGNINAEYTTCYIQFPEDAEKIREQYKKLPDKFIPGLRLQNSDCGRSSFIVSLTMNVTRGNVTGVTEFSSFNQKHTSKIDVNSIAKKASRMFDEVNQLPKLMCELLKADILEACVDDLVNTIADKINLKKEIGIKNAKKITTNVANNVRLLPNRTAYDVVMEFICANDSNFFTNKKAQHNFEQALGRIVKIDFDVILSKVITV